MINTGIALSVILMFIAIFALADIVYQRRVEKTAGDFVYATFWTCAIFSVICFFAGSDSLNKEYLAAYNGDRAAQQSICMHSDPNVFAECLRGYEQFNTPPAPE